MDLGISFRVYQSRGISFKEAMRDAVERGFTHFELPIHKHNGHLDLDDLLVSGVAKRIKEDLRDYGLRISALSNHREGQLVLGPHHSDTDRYYAGNRQSKIEYGIKRLVQTAQAANLLEVPIVVGFLGCEDFSRWYPWPDVQGWENMSETFVDRTTPILDQFKGYGVLFAQECHVKQYAYSAETALYTLELLEHRPEWGFAFDPANLLQTGSDPLTFISLLNSRIYYAHLKDAEIVTHQIARTGLMAPGSLARINRGFRFRIPGWGDLPWKKILTELRLLVGNIPLTVEIDDPTMKEDEGLKKAVDFLAPLLFEHPADKGTEIFAF